MKIPLLSLALSYLAARATSETNLHPNKTSAEVTPLGEWAINPIEEGLNGQPLTVPSDQPGQRATNPIEEGLNGQPLTVPNDQPDQRTTNPIEEGLNRQPFIVPSDQPGQRTTSPTEETLPPAYSELGEERKAAQDFAMGHKLLQQQLQPTSTVSSASKDSAPVVSLTNVNVR